ncbi:MAG: hypothetical protein A2W26_12755 [Acidobacteria bacterium RBG_16_64_8]|nr:MAG: hypothetical protein A2W26_12755 [Acidobacteria bacterium RBG_16_64_8]
MKKVPVVYFSLTGNTQKMAEYIAEGVRFSGNEAVTGKTSDIRTADQLAGYDGYIFGSPAYHRDMAEPMKNLLFLAAKADLKTKLVGAFGSSTHIGDAPAMILDTTQHVHKMRPVDLGAFNLVGDDLGTGEGLHACRDYGKYFRRKLGA